MSFKNFLLVFSISLASFSVMAGHHQSEHMDHSDMTHEQSASSCADDDSCDMTRGVVVSVNKEKRKIVLNHEEIKNIDILSFIRSSHDVNPTEQNQDQVNSNGQPI